MRSIIFGSSSGPTSSHYVDILPKEGLGFGGRNNKSKGITMKEKRDKKPVRLSQKQLSPLTDDQLAKLETVPAGEIVTICQGQAIPSGWVIVSQGSSINCPGNFPNTWNIKKPGATEVVCSVSPIPANYVIVGQGSSINCPGSFPNTETIRKV